MDGAVESVDDAQADGERHADFALAFQDGRTAVDQRGETLTVRVAHLGNLVVTTGHIVACDPFWLDMAPEPYTTVVPCGQYPVLVSVISYADGDQRVACAMLRFTNGEAIRWEMALRPGQDVRTLAPGELFCYSVDAGTGCFADQAVVEALLAEAGIHDVDDWRIGPAGPHLTPDGDTTPEWRALVDAVYTWNEAFGNQLVEKLEAA